MKNINAKNSKIKSMVLNGLFCGLATFSSVSIANSNAIKNNLEKGAHENKSAGIKLSTAQRQLANIKVTSLQRQPMSYSIYAPGEIKANDYTSYLVSPRVDSIVLKRHVALGENVEQGQALVTLFSAYVAEAQANYRVAKAEWQRVQKLGRKAVGDKRYVETENDFQADFGRLLAFGLSKQAILSLAKTSDTLGQYTLNAITSGAVLSDHFRQGQRVNSGDTLIELADEKVLWVEARLAPTMQLSLPVGSKAQVLVAGKTYSATVTQKAHTIDPHTRTRIVRLQVENHNDQLHPGLFADVYFPFETKPILAVPESALMRGIDGNWQVFYEKNGVFKGKEVSLGRSLSAQEDSSLEKWREITNISAGTKVVTKGAFYVFSEIAKSSFGDDD